MFRIRIRFEPATADREERTREGLVGLAVRMVFESIAGDYFALNQRVDRLLAPRSLRRCAPISRVDNC